VFKLSLLSFGRSQNYGLPDNFILIPTALWSVNVSTSDLSNWYTQWTIYSSLDIRYVTAGQHERRDAGGVGSDSVGSCTDESAASRVWRYHRQHMRCRIAEQSQRLMQRF